MAIRLLKDPIVRGNLTRVDEDDISLTLRFYIQEGNGPNAVSRDVTIQRFDVQEMSTADKQAIRATVAVLLKFGGFEFVA